LFPVARVAAAKSRVCPFLNKPTLETCSVLLAAAGYATLVRTGVILTILAVFVAVAGKWRNPSTLLPRSLLFLVLSGLATGASWVCYFRALKVGDASRVAPIDKLSVVLVALFATIFLGERPVPRDWVGIGLVGAGVLLLGLRR
jgi:transporter family protein